MIRGHGTLANRWSHVELGAFRGCFPAVTAAVSQFLDGIGKVVFGRGVKDHQGSRQQNAATAQSSYC